MPRIMLLALFLTLWPAAASAEDRALDLAIGDPAKKERVAPLLLDAITDTASGELLTPRALAPRLAGVSLLFVGESHDSVASHQVQKRVIEELLAAGRKVMIGLEMMPYPKQQALDHWSAGLLTEEGFLTLGQWYDSWGYHWHYYRDIFLLARDHHLPMVALNAPREVISSVRKKGFKDLTPEEAAHIPTTIDLGSEDHRTLIRTFFEGDDAAHAAMSPEQFESMFAAQCTWDATMAFHATEALAKRGEPGSILVVLVGAGHVVYGMGLERQARQWLDPARHPMASLVPISLPADGTAPVVRASVASFLWGVAAETHPPHPRFGFSTSSSPGQSARTILLLEEGGPAEAAGVAVGDLVLAIDGTPVPDRETLNRLMASKQWGDEVVLTIRRGEETKNLTLLLRRTMSTKPGA